MTERSNKYNNPEPTFFTLKPQEVKDFAVDIAKQLELRDGIKYASAFMIPNADNPSQLLYGLRGAEPNNPTKEFVNAWGLPSTSIPEDLFLRLASPDGVLNLEAAQEATNLIAHTKQKLPSINLVVEKVVGWTGRIRDGIQDPRFFGKKYYLVMVNLKTQPTNSNLVSISSEAYERFAWMTPEEYMKEIAGNEIKACGACSALAWYYYNRGVS